MSSSAPTRLLSLGRAAWVGLVFLLSAGAGGLAAAHTQNGTLGSVASATDHYEVTCYDDGSGSPQSLSVEIRDSSPGALPQVSAHVQRNETVASTSDDTAANGSPGPEIHINEGPGVYRVLVTKTGSGTKFYSVSFHCNVGLNGTGAHAGSVISVLQSQ